jgi:hypothetical protein
MKKLDNWSVHMHKKKGVMKTIFSIPTAARIHYFEFGNLTGKKKK